MRNKFERLPDLDAKHNDIHRLCFETPFLTKEVSTAPTVDELEGGELVFCVADSKLYYKTIAGSVIKTSALS